MSAGAPFGPAYGAALALGGVPDAMLQGQNIARQRQLEDLQRTQLAQELDRLRTQREVEGYSGNVPSSIQYQNGAAPVYGAAGQTDIMAPTGTEGSGALPQATNPDAIPTIQGYKPTMASRPLSDEERKAAIFKNQSDYALKRGRADLATGAMDKSHQATIQNMQLQARRAFDQLTTDNNFDGARQTLNQMGMFGNITKIGRNDAGDYVFTDDQGNAHPMSEEDMKAALYRMSTDPTIYSRWNVPAITRANAVVQGRQISADSAERRQEVKAQLAREGFQNTATMAHEKNLTAIEVAKLRVAAQNYRTTVLSAGSARQSDLQFLYGNAKRSLESQGLPADPDSIMSIVADQKGLIAGSSEYNKTKASMLGLKDSVPKKTGTEETPAPYGRKKPTPAAAQDTPPGPGAVWSPTKKSWFKQNADGTYSPY